MQMLLGSPNLFRAMKVPSPQLFLAQFYGRKVRKMDFLSQQWRREICGKYFFSSCDEEKKPFNKIFNLMIFER